MHHECFAYYRVSTKRQGESGLGLEAQRAAAKNYLDNQSVKLLGEFTEIESGRKSDRPELNTALAACRKTGATLLIAKLDRLARNVHFISGLLESDVRFIAIDMPTADRFMLHVYAAMAEEEARRISERTRAALRSAKARGVELGKHGKVLAKQYAREADDFCEALGPEVAKLHQNDGLSFREIADCLNEAGISTAKGGRWHTTTVHRLHNRFQTLVYNRSLRVGVI